jgi:glycosyltransferase involved in cell wall biosynthesis
MKRQQEKILISVAMITYDHEAYIREAIEGVLMQSGDFEVELIIANDHSTDGTESIVLDLIKNHKNGGWIKYTYHQVNKGMKANFIWSLNQAQGKYIALCEGDDYWTDPLKLQKQVSFLEANPAYVFSFHNAQLIKTAKNEIVDKFLTENRDYFANDLFLRWVAPTASFVFAASCVSHCNKYLDKPDVLNPDLVLVLSCLEQGKARGSAEILSVYRIHEKGISQVRFMEDRLSHLKNYIKHYKFIGKHFPAISKKNVNVKLVDTYSSIALYYFNKKDIRFFIYVLKCLHYRPELIYKGIKKVL